MTTRFQLVARPDFYTPMIPRNLGFAGMRKVYPCLSAGAGSDFTYLDEVVAEDAFDYVRLGYLNCHLANPYTIDVAKVAPAAAFGNNGTGLTWTQVKFDTSAAGIASANPPSAAGVTTTIDVPAATSGTGGDIIPGLTWSDWMAVTSLARTDGTRYPILHARTHLSTAATIPNLSGAVVATPFNQAVDNKRGWRGAVAAGDHVTVIDSLAMGDGPTWHALSVVQFAYRRWTFNIAQFGDSITQGQGSVNASNGIYGWGTRAAAMLSDRAGPIYQCTNWGASGQHKAVTVAIMQKILVQGRCDYATFFPWTPNDAQATLLTSWATTTAMLDLCMRYGVTPIVCTSPPAAQISTLDADRITINNRVRALRGGPVLVCDFDKALTNGASPARILSQWSDDSIHPNDAGHAMLAGLLANTILAG